MEEQEIPSTNSTASALLPRVAQHPHSVKTSSELCGLDPGLSGSRFSGTDG